MSHLMAPATGMLIPGEQGAATVAVSLERSDRSSPPRGTNPFMLLKPVERVTVSGPLSSCAYPFTRASGGGPCYLLQCLV
jgi:hypothetical protein